MSEHNDNRESEMSDDPNHTEVMTAYVEPEAEADFEDYDEFGDEEVVGSHPPRARRVLVNRWSALLLAVLIGGACFYLGVRVEKSKVGTSSTGSASALSGLASRFAAGGSGTAGGGRSGGGGFSAAGFGGGAVGGGTTGTITTIDGDTLYISETGGNTVKVNLSKATTLKKTSTVARKKLYPGDTVSITGTTGSGGAIKATAVTDSGSSGSTTSTGSTSGSTGSSSSSTSGSSALSSLFGG